MAAARGTPRRTQRERSDATSAELVTAARRLFAADAVKVGLRAIRTGTTRLPPGYAYRTEAGGTRAALGFGVPRDAWITAPIGAFLVEHPSAGPLLIDTGMHPVTAVEPRRNLGRLGAATHDAAVWAQLPARF